MSNLEFGIEWNDSYKLGNEQVDSQHYQLFKMANNLIRSCVEGGDAEHLLETLRGTLDFLVEYTVKHFFDEEVLQVLHNYPDYNKHKQLHEEFKVEVCDLVKRFEESNSLEDLSDDVNKIIVKWLIKHISIEDRKMCKYIMDK